MTYDGKLKLVTVFNHGLAAALAYGRWLAGVEARNKPNTLSWSLTDIRLIQQKPVLPLVGRRRMSFDRT